MALKPYRKYGQDTMDFFMDEVAERGGFVVASTVGSGEANDQGVALVTYTTAPSGKIPLGCLMQDMVNKDLSQTHINFYKDEVQKGSKVNLWTEGTVVTNMIYPGMTPAAQKGAYLGPSGLLQTVAGNDVSVPFVGVFLSSKDADGYAKVVFNLPASTPRI